jgi:hypothetical protein
LAREGLIHPYELHISGMHEVSTRTLHYAVSADVCSIFRGVDSSG